MMLKVLVALGLAAALSFAPLAAVAHEGHDHGTKAKKIQEIKAEEGSDRIHGVARDSVTRPGGAWRSGARSPENWQLSGTD